MVDSDALPGQWAVSCPGDESGMEVCRFQLGRAGGGLFVVWVVRRAREEAPFEAQLTTISDRDNRVRHDYPIGVSLPVVETLTVAVVAAVLLNAMLGVADAFREPASMALFADEGKANGIASSFGVRSLVWKPGSVIAPLAGGWLMATIGIEWVFYAGGAGALTGVVSFLGVLSWNHGGRAPAVVTCLGSAERSSGTMPCRRGA